jgi:hypothetical protein
MRQNFGLNLSPFDQTGKDLEGLEVTGRIRKARHLAGDRAMGMGTGPL